MPNNVYVFQFQAKLVDHLINGLLKYTYFFVEMEKRSFQEKRSPSKNSGTPKQRFKPPLFGNDEKHPGPQGPTQSIQLEPPIAGKIRAPRSAERTQSRKSESSISGENVFQDETSKFPNSKMLAKSLPNTSQAPSAGDFDIMKLQH